MSPVNQATGYVPFAEAGVWHSLAKQTAYLFNVQMKIEKFYIFKNVKV